MTAERLSLSKGCTLFGCLEQIGQLCSYTHNEAGLSILFLYISEHIYIYMHASLCNINWKEKEAINLSKAGEGLEGGVLEGLAEGKGGEVMQLYFD